MKVVRNYLSATARLVTLSPTVCDITILGVLASLVRSIFLGFLLRRSCVWIVMILMIPFVCYNLYQMRVRLICMFIYLRSRNMILLILVRS